MYNNKKWKTVLCWLTNLEQTTLSIRASAIKASFKVSQWHWTSPTLISSDLDELTEPKSEIILAIGCCYLHSSGARKTSSRDILRRLPRVPIPSSDEFHGKTGWFTFSSVSPKGVFSTLLKESYFMKEAKEWDHFGHSLLLPQIFPDSEQWGPKRKPKVHQGLLSVGPSRFLCLPPALHLVVISDKFHGKIRWVTLFKKNFLAMRAFSFTLKVWYFVKYGKGWN